MTFSSATPQTRSVSINDDGLDEWNPDHMDEAFFIDLDPPSPPDIATLVKSRATVTIVDDDRAFPGLQFASAVADGSASLGRVCLHWRVPAASSTSGPVEDVLVRWNSGPSCPAPTDATVGAVGQFYVAFDRLIPVNQAGDAQMVEHLIPNPPPFEKHCYALFAVYSQPGPSGIPTTERAVIDATPFDSGAGPVAWAYSTGFPNVVAPTVGQTAVYTVSTDGVVHAMERTSGAWPTGWNPVSLGRDKAASNRSPVVPLPHGQRLLIGTESGEVHSVDGENGAITWSRSATFNGEGPLPNISGEVQGTPAGLFTGFGGQRNAILVGTYVGPSNNTFYMLDPVTGANKSTFSHSAMGGMRGMAAVDYLGYPDNRVHFVTNSTSGTLWALDLGTTALAQSSLPGGNPVSLGGANGSPVLRSLLYVGGRNAALDGRLYQINVASPDPQGTKKSVLPEPGSWIGAPSLDSSKDLVLVGSSTGVVYAVRLPLLAQECP